VSNLDAVLAADEEQRATLVTGDERAVGLSSLVEEAAYVVF
jgi:hypothetical protein